MDPELRERLKDYLGGALTFRELGLWLVVRLQGYFNSGDKRLSRQVGELDALIAEITAGLSDESELRQFAFSILSPNRETLRLTSTATESVTLARMQEFKDQSWASRDLELAGAYR